MSKQVSSPQETLQEIRSLMERSSRFLSLSGLSGVAAGVFALAGAAMAYVYLGTTPFDHEHVYYLADRPAGRWGLSLSLFFLLDGGLVLLAALVAGVWFTTRKARRKGQRIWDALTRRLLLSLAIPLVTGGLFLLALYYHGISG